MFDNARLHFFIIYLLLVLYITLSCAKTSEQSAGSRVFVLRPVLGAWDRHFVIERQVCSLSTKPQVSTTFHYTIKACCNRTEHSQHCLPASAKARELNLKYAWTNEELNPEPFALASECITTRLSRPLHCYNLVRNYLYNIPIKCILTTWSHWNREWTANCVRVSSINIGCDADVISADVYIVTA